MPRKTIKPRNKREEIPQWHIGFLCSGEWPPPGYATFPRFFRFHDDKSSKPVWNQVRDSVLVEWIKKHPGTRPWFWWRTEALGYRRIIDGTITDDQLKEASCHSENGIPDYAQTYIFLKEIEFLRFESQASALKRWGLLSKTEEKQADFEPEIIKNEL